MATLTQTIKLSPSNSAILTFNITDGPDRVTVTLTTVAFKNTNSGGTAYRWTLSGWSDIGIVFAGGGTVEFGNYNIPVGTTSRSWSPNKTKVLMKNYPAAPTEKEVDIDSDVTIEKYGAEYDWYDGHKDSEVTVSAYATYSVTYNANGGSNAPISDVKAYNQTLTLSTAKPTRTNYVFKNWNTNSAGTGTAYASGASYTANAALALYAQWYAPYTVAYNANGGTGAPASQVKVYNTALTLSTVKPTRQDFAFVSWNTSSAGSGTSYASGASYTANANATLYAQWQRTYSDPKASVVSVQRVDAAHEADDGGTSVAVVVSWSLFDTPSGTNHPTSIVVACNGVSVTLTDLTGLTGTATAYLDAGCDTEHQYAVTAALTDEGGASRSATAEGVVTTPYYPIDIRQGGMGVAIGGPSAEDAFDVFMPTKILPSSTSTSKSPLVINDGTGDVLKVGWDGNVVAAGAFQSVDPRFDAEASSLAETIYSTWGVKDADGRHVMYLETYETPAGQVATHLAARRVVNGANVDNQINLRVAADGTRSVGLSDRAAWLSALGYVAPTALPLNSACTAYDSAGTPRYARDGHVVSVWGVVKPTSEVAAGGTMTIGTLPAGYRPPNTIYVVCHGSYAAMWLLSINTGGTLTAQRYSSNNETYAAMTTGVWMPFSATFITTS